MMSRGVAAMLALMIGLFGTVGVLALTTASSKSLGAGWPFGLIGTRPRLQLPGSFQSLLIAPVQRLSTASAAGAAHARTTAAPASCLPFNRARTPTPRFDFEFRCDT